MSRQDRQSYVPLQIMGHPFGVPENRVRAFGRLNDVKLSEQGECKIKYNEETVTVIDPVRFLGRPAPSSKPGTYLAILETTNGLLGLLVESRRPAFSAQLGRLPEPFSNWSGEILSGLVMSDHGLLPILDCEQLEGFVPKQDTVPAKPALPNGQTAPSPPSGTSAANARVVIFPVGQESSAPHLGLSLAQVPEVRDRLSFAWMPGAPAWVRGIAIWQTQSAIVLDVGEMCGLGRTDPERWMVVQGFNEGERYVLPVGRDVRILPASNARENVDLPEKARTWVHGAYALSETPFWLLDVDRVSSAWRGAHS